MARRLLVALLALVACKNPTPSPAAVDASVAAPIASLSVSTEPIDAGPPPRSPMPTVAEWDAAPETPARGNDPVCEVKVLRGWARIACRRKSAGGGEPTAVWIARGKTREAFLFATPGSTSVIAPVALDIEARFSWTDVVWSVSVTAAGIDFRKTDDKPTKDVLTLPTCACLRQASPGAKCAESDPIWQTTSSNPTCEKTYAGDCTKILACDRDAGAP